MNEDLFGKDLNSTTEGLVDIFHLVNWKISIFKLNYLSVWVNCCPSMQGTKTGFIKITKKQTY